MSEPQRLTRKQRQEHTRSCLLEAAARVFARRGLTQASVDEVAADAGFTKGAVYANFGSKEALFLEMLEQRFAQRLVDMERAMSSDEPPEVQARAAAQDFIDVLTADPDWRLLFFEAALQAARDDAFRARLQEHFAAMRARMADLLRARAAAGGFDPDVPFEDLATMIMAMANGIGFEQLVEPAAVPDGMFSTMVEIFTLGATARAATGQTSAT